LDKSRQAQPPQRPVPRKPSPKAWQARQLKHKHHDYLSISVIKHNYFRAYFFKNRHSSGIILKNKKPYKSRNFFDYSALLNF